LKVRHDARSVGRHAEGVNAAPRLVEHARRAQHIGREVAVQAHHQVTELLRGAEVLVRERDGEPVQLQVRAQLPKLKAELVGLCGVQASGGEAPRCVREALLDVARVRARAALLGLQVAHLGLQLDGAEAQLVCEGRRALQAAADELIALDQALGDGAPLKRRATPGEPPHQGADEAASARVALQLVELGALRLERVELAAQLLAHRDLGGRELPHLTHALGAQRLQRVGARDERRLRGWSAVGQGGPSC